jgi:uncharacterized protein (TIGR00299 family) protein
MTKLLYFDAFNGVAGDMVLGALVDMGLPLSYLEERLRTLPLEHFHLQADQVLRSGIRGTSFQVQIPKHHGGDHDRAVHAGDHGHHRGFREVDALLEASALEPWVKETARAIFRRLGAAEAKVHGVSLESVHFHEVGAVDAIVDIVGACLGFRYFGVEEFYASPLHLGGGTVTFSHGAWPVPAPATAELVTGFPVRLGGVDAELTTPTGAAIVTTLARPGSLPPLCSFVKWGWGAGDRRVSGIPNMLRLMLAEIPEPVAGPDAWPDVLHEEVLLLEAAIDDMDAQAFGYFLDLALDAGALDVYFTPVHMKKNRPGHLATVLCRVEDGDKMAELLFTHTTTLGLRCSLIRRWVLERKTLEVDLEPRPVRVKAGYFRGRLVNVSPEYEDLKAAAEQAGLPLKAMRQQVMRRLRELPYE